MRFSEPMQDQVRVRLDRDEKRVFFRAAKRRGLSLSEFIRTVAREASQGIAA